MKTLIFTKSFQENDIPRYVTTQSVSLTVDHLWTSENVVKSPFNDIVIPSKTIPEHIWEHLDKWANKTAIICGVTNYSYTYHQLYRFSRNFAVQLRTQLKICNDDVICVMMHNCPDYALAVLGILQAGAIVTTINPNYTAFELKGQLLLCNPKVIISVPDRIEVIKEGLRIANMDIPLIMNKKCDDDLPTGTIYFEELCLDSDSDPSILNGISRKTDDVAFLIFSSGTTGVPKGVELSHQSLVISCAHQDVDGFKLYNDTTSSNQDSILAVLPLYHIYGLLLIMLQKLSVGMKIVTLPKFHPSTFLPALKAHNINRLYVTPPIVLYLASCTDVKGHHLESIKTIICGAAPTPMSDIIKVLEKIKHKVDFIQVYGMTESLLVTATMPGRDDYTTAGFAVPNTELRIVDSNYHNLGPNEIGELLIKGPQIMKGYRNSPEATKAAITGDGWLKTGDLAKISEEGIVTIVNRLKEVIKVKSYTVSPVELESVLKEHPDILDAAVIGVPDAKYGEIPKAFIVIKGGSNIDTEEVTNFVADRVSEYKRIKEIMILDSLPKNPTGKVMKSVLKDKFGKTVSL